MPDKRFDRKSHVDVSPPSRGSKKAEDASPMVPVRAWLRDEVAEEANLPEPLEPVYVPPGTWSLFIEDGIVNDTVRGPFQKLLERARREAGIVFVYDYEKRDFIRVQG